MRLVRSLQFVVLAPVMALMLVAGTALYFLVLRTVGDHVDANIRANLDSLASTAFAIADAKVDRQNIEGLAGDSKATRRYKVRTFKDFEDFAREHEIGLIVIADKTVRFATGPDSDVAEANAKAVQGLGERRLRVFGHDYYVRGIDFAPWDWRIILVKDASAFEALVGEVQVIYVGTVAMLLLVTLGLVIWLRQVLVRPIAGIARDFVEGRDPAYQGVRELQELSESIGRMKRDLEARTLHLDVALQSMTDAITVFDREMRLIAWNPQFVQLYQYPDGFIREGLRFEEIMRFNVERGDYGDVDVEAEIEHLVTRGRNMDPPQWEVGRADGTTIEIRRARMPDGGFVTTYTDITDRKQAQEAEVARRKAEAANEAKTQFLRNMGHDLRKPLVAIKAFTELVMRKGRSNLPEKQYGNLENVLICADHLHGTVDALLEMSRLEAGQVKVTTEPVAIAPLVEEHLRIIKPATNGKKIELVAEIEDGLQVHTGREQLSRIVGNLLGNAAKFTEQGKINVSARARNGSLEIAVADTGIGIPPDRLATIFEKFEQVEPTSGLVKPGMGLGLGLSISREFAHLIGGEISVESELGRGSTFTLTIPIELTEAKV